MTRKKFSFTNRKARRQALSRVLESAEAYERRLKEQRERQRARRKAETVEETNRRLEYQRVRQRVKRARESIDERNRRLEKQRIRICAKRACETADERERRRKEQRLRQRARRARETPEESYRRHEKQRLKQRAKRASKTVDENNIDLQQPHSRQTISLNFENYLTEVQERNFSSIKYEGFPQLDIGNINEESEDINNLYRGNFVCVDNRNEDRKQSLCTTTSVTIPSKSVYSLKISSGERFFENKNENQKDNAMRNEQNNQFNNNLKSTKELHRCNKCSKEFLSLITLFVHKYKYCKRRVMRSSVKRRYQCNLCRKNYFYKSCLKSHLLMHIK